MFTERGKTFTRFQCGWKFIPNDGCSNRETSLPRFSLVLGIESSCEVDDLSCLGMLEKCRRLAR